MERVKPSPISYLQIHKSNPKNRRYTWRKLTPIRLKRLCRKSSIIFEVKGVSQARRREVRKSALAPRSQSGIHPSTDQAVVAAKQAQAEFVQLGFAKRREIIEAIKLAALENAQRLADLAVEDTGMGTAAHKLMKNEGAVNLSPGVEDLRSEASTGDEGTLLVEYVPFGVINSITPTTNPTSTVINHAIIMLSAGNAVVFSPHPNAAKCTHENYVRHERSDCEVRWPTQSAYRCR